MKPINFQRLVAISLTLLALPACSTIIEGRSQQVQVNTNPPGASCDFLRNGESIASVAPTPGGTYIEKTKYDLNIKCNKPGYQESTYLDHSGVDWVTAGNVLLGGLIGWGIDSATGADNLYSSPVNITLPKK